MAFPWQLFEDLPLATSNIVEDLGLAVYLTGSGTAPVYLEQAFVTSLPASEGATLDQRTRWEHGFIATAREFGIDSLWKGASSLNWKHFLLGLHLMVPPVALLFGMTLLTLIYVHGGLRDRRTYSSCCSAFRFLLSRVSHYSRVDMWRS